MIKLKEVKNTPFWERTKAIEEVKEALKRRAELRQVTGETSQIDLADDITGHLEPEEITL